MLKFTKNFAGSYKSETEFATFYIETHRQHTSEDGGTGWVLSIIEDFHGDLTTFVKTKKEAQSVADTFYLGIVSGEIKIEG